MTITAAGLNACLEESKVSNSRLINAQSDRQINFSMFRKIKLDQIG